jgi:hypothetical protein
MGSLREYQLTQIEGFGSVIFYYLSLPAASVYFNYTEQAKCLNITNQGETIV